MRAIGYVRVSTEGQATEGVSLDAQRARIKVWAEANSYELVSVHEDAGLSGSRSDNRPGLQEAIAEACRLKCALVVYSLSRLARSTRDAIGISEKMEKAGADLVSLSEKLDTTSASGKMIFRLMAVLAEFERDQISERTREALRHKKAKGERVGTVPYGFEAVDGRLAPMEREQKALVSLRAMRSDGMAYGRIANRLNQDGIRTKNGGRWFGETVRSVLSHSRV